MKTLLVEACEGREVPIHQNDNPTGGALVVKPGDAPVELADTLGVRRRIRAGDLRVVQSDLAKRVDASMSPEATK